MHQPLLRTITALTLTLAVSAPLAAVAQAQTRGVRDRAEDMRDRREDGTGSKTCSGHSALARAPEPRPANRRTRLRRPVDSAALSTIDLVLLWQFENARRSPARNWR